MNQFDPQSGRRQQQPAGRARPETQATQRGSTSIQASGGHAQVRSGTRGRYVYRSVRSGLNCDVGAFGNAPYPGPSQAVRNLAPSE